jgi:hypothetical protein
MGDERIETEHAQDQMGMGMGMGEGMREGMVKGMGMGMGKGIGMRTEMGIEMGMGMGMAGTTKTYVMKGIETSDYGADCTGR